jgi:hypothetical protein
VAGTSGSISHTVDIVVLITQPGPKCLIATASFGSELAPEVQLLRTLRDDEILKTKAGTSFMIAFNTWYYSFSPAVANYLNNHWVERTMTKIILYPLIGILALTQDTFVATSSYPELGALLAGLLASSLIGAFYLGLPLSVLRLRIRRFRIIETEKSLRKELGILLLSGIAALALGELLNQSVVLMVSSSLIVVSSIFLSSIVTSSKIAPILSSCFDRIGRLASQTPQTCESDTNPQ